MTPADGYRRRAADTRWWYRAWIAMPLVDRQTGDLSLSRILALMFAVATVHRMEAHELVRGWADVTESVAMASLSLASAFGKRVFEAVALRIAGRGQSMATATNPTDGVPPDA